MKPLHKICALAICFLFLYGCQEDVPLVLIDPEEELVFDIERSESVANFSSKAEKISLKSKSSSWRLKSNEEVELSREIIFDVELENEMKIDFGFKLIKSERNQDLLILEDEDLDWRERNWDYREYADKVNNFYNDLDDVQLLLDEKIILIHRFNILEQKKALVYSEEKIYINAFFSGGRVFSSSVNYQIRNGSFKGVIE